MKVVKVLGLIVLAIVIGLIAGGVIYRINDAREATAVAAQKDFRDRVGKVPGLARLTVVVEHKDRFFLNSYFLKVSGVVAKEADKAELNAIGSKVEPHVPWIMSDVRVSQLEFEFPPPSPPAPISNDDLRLPDDLLPDAPVKP